MKKKILERSKKSQEAYADYLMKVSSALFTAFLVAILIVPIGAIFKGALDSNSTNVSLVSFFTSIGIWKGILFLACEFVIFWMSDNFRNRALEIYDSLELNELEKKVN